MLTTLELSYINLYLEGFLFGVYSGIFAIYLQSPGASRAKIIFYVLCSLYILSTATFVCDLLIFMIEIYYEYPITDQFYNDMLLLYYRMQFVQATVIGCCDAIAQFILIFRCWIVWRRNIRVVIIPSFLAITFIATWLAGEGTFSIFDNNLEGSLVWGLDGFYTQVTWGDTLTLTALAATMAVNTLVTGLIIFKIYKVFLEVKATSESVERTSGSSFSLNPKLQNSIFIIIESGMALFAIQLARIVVTSLVVVRSLEAAGPLSSSSSLYIALQFVLIFHQAINGIAPTIIYVRVAMSLSFDDEESFKESLRFNKPPSDPNTQLEALESMPAQERNEEICFNNSPSDPNSLLRLGVGSSSSNTPSLDSERIKDIDIDIIAA